MKIQVLGSNCTTCKKMYELTVKAVQELGLKDGVEYVTDIEKIIKMGVLSTPVLVINDKPVVTGFVPGVGMIKKIIQKSIQ